MGGHRPLPIDAWWHDLLDAPADWLVAVAWVPSVVGGTSGVIVVGAVLVVAFVVRGRRWDAATLAAALVAVVALGAPMAAVIARIRPADSLAESVATSFPSGHTAVATTLAVTLGLLLRRTWVWLVGGTWVVLMMGSRTVLSAHWLSDVVAGLLEGIAVACLVWCVATATADRHARRGAAMMGTTTDEGQDG